MPADQRVTSNKFINSDMYGETVEFPGFYHLSAVLPWPGLFFFAQASHFARRCRKL